MYGFWEVRLRSFGWDLKRLDCRHDKNDTNTTQTSRRLVSTAGQQKLQRVVGETPSRLSAAMGASALCAS